MGGGDPLLELDVEDVRRYRTRYGAVDALALSVQYNATFQEAASSAHLVPGETPEFIRTLFHETTHLYQMLTTPYGYYYYTLRAFQVRQTLSLLRLLKNEHRLRVQVPLLGFIERLEPRERYRDVWGVFYLWYLAEMVLLYFEGEWDVWSGQATRNRVLQPASFVTYFTRLNLYLNQFNQLTGRDTVVAPGPVITELSDVAKQEEEMWISFRASIGVPTDVIGVLESGAKVAEHWRDEGDDLGGLSARLTSGPMPQPEYYAMLQIMHESFRFKSIRELVLTYSALCELALYAPLLPHHQALRPHEDLSLLSMSPSTRLMLMFTTARKVQRVRDLEADYQRFHDDVCGALGWPTPLQMSRQAVARQPDGDDAITRLYYRAQELRLGSPHAFVDLAVWYDGSPSPFAGEITRSYVHPVMEFRDRVLFHQDKQVVRDFVFNYLLTTYLRKLLLTGKLELTLPYRSTEGEARLWQDILADSLAQAGIERARVTVRPGTGATHLEPAPS
jgi:hypothetical protein